MIPLKSGDKIVCVKNIRHAYMLTPRLYIYNVYTFDSYYEIYSGKKFIRVKEHSYMDYYPEESFVSMIEYRKLKLEKLNENR